MKYTNILLLLKTLVYFSNGEPNWCNCNCNCIFTPTPEPTSLPTNEPTNVPTKEPTNVPTNEPTNVPTKEPTNEPECNIMPMTGLPGFDGFMFSLPPEEFLIEANVVLYSNSSGWSNLYQLGESNRPRLASAFIFPGSSQLTFRIAYSMTSDYICEPNRSLVLGEWTVVTLRIINGFAIGEFDGVQVCSVNLGVNGALGNTGVGDLFFTGSKHYAAPDACIEYITVSPMNGYPRNITYASDIITSIYKPSWKIFLPVDINGDDSYTIGATTLAERNMSPLTIFDANLINYENKPYFYEDNGEVVFRAHSGGATTSGTKYPRTELRQRVGGGDNYWSVNDFQSLEAEIRLVDVPLQKTNTVITQIHSSGTPQILAIMYNVNYGIYIEYNEYYSTRNDSLLYNLGERLYVNITVDNDLVICYIANLDSLNTTSNTWVSNYTHGAFQIGAYSLSSIFLNEIEGDPYINELPDAGSEVRIRYINIVETYNNETKEY